MTVRSLPDTVATPARLRVITGHARSLSRALVWSFYTVATVVAFLTLIFLRTAVDESVFEIRELERRIEVELARQHQLHLQKIRLESPGEIVPIAENMLGMVLPEDVIPVTVGGQAGGDANGAGSTAGARAGALSEPPSVPSAGDPLTSNK